MVGEETFLNIRRTPLGFGVIIRSLLIYIALKRRKPALCKQAF